VFTSVRHWTPSWANRIHPNLLHQGQFQYYCLFYAQVSQWCLSFICHNQNPACTSRVSLSAKHIPPVISSDCSSYIHLVRSTPYETSHYSLLRPPVSNPILGPITSARFTYSRCSDQATRWTIRGSITGTRRNYLFFESPDRFRGPPSLLSNGYRGVFSASKAARMCNWPLTSVYYRG
jgi:hypothetical protein